MTENAWEEIATHIWKYVIGEPQFTCLSVSNTQPKTDAIAQLPSASLPFEPHEIQIQKQDQGIVVRIPLTPQEQLYGLGLQFKKINQRNGVFHLQVDHYGGKDTGRTHAPVPFYVSSSGYGVLINTSSDPTFYMGSANRKDSPNPPPAKDRTTDRTWSAHPTSDAVEIFIPDPQAEVLLFAGPTPLDVVRRYNLYCGGGCLPPRWGLGFWHRIPTPYIDAQAENEIEEFSKRNFPVHVLGLEPGWQNKAYPCSYEWSEDRFPNPQKFVQSMRNKNIRINLWENPYIAPETTLYKALYPLSGSHTVWCGLVPDYTLSETQKVLADQHEQHHIATGVSGYKIDECDGYDRWLWPNHATFPSGHTGIQMRQTYGLQLQNLTTNIFRKNNTRTYGLVRASNAGGQSLPYVIYNDYYDHKDYITALCNSGFSGILWCPEVRKAKSAEDWVRRIQTACFSPLMQLNAWADGTKPWSYPEVESAVRDLINLRIRLTSYLYSAFARYCTDGTPPFRPMALEARTQSSTPQTQGALDGTDNPYAIPESADTKDQYMMGDVLLVAPIFEGETQRNVILPQGNWYDFYTGQYAGNGQTITVSPDLNTIPLYVKDGGIIPLLTEKQDLHQNPQALDVHYYGHTDGQFLLYNDDGETYNYEQGDYTLQKLAVTQQNGQRIGISTHHAGNQKWLCDTLNWIYKTP